MDADAGPDADKARRDQDIRAQIAALQAQLAAAPPASPPPNKRPREITLAPATPSPRKKKKIEETRQGTAAKSSSASTRKPPPKPVVPSKPGPSKLLSKLATHKTTAPGDEEEAPQVVRSTAFTDKPAVQSAPLRDDNLAIIDEIEPGPYDHRPPFDDPNFNKLEPHSGIRLASRTLSHEDLDEHMTGRFYISPSRLYSCVRLAPDKQSYDVPVAGDWLTIAVVAERGPICYTKAPIPLQSDKTKGKDKAPPKPTGKKYVIIKLVDLGSRAKSSSSATGGKAIVRGDACLSLFLFESDGHDTVTAEGSSKTKKLYKGGSGGAFEAMSKLKEGDVIVLMNAKIMKPNQGARNAQHNILGLTPESAASITSLGRAADLGLCPAVKRDGSTCHSWYDKRAAQACDWHIQDAVKRTRSARPEFSIGTTGMANTSIKKRNPAFDPSRQWGLKPEAEGSTTTYILNGHVARSQPRDTVEKMGREAQAKAQRVSAKNADKMLKTLLDRDKDGMKAVMSAREFMNKQEEERRAEKKGKGKEGEKVEKEKRKVVDSDEASTKPNVKNSFDADTIKRLGFDPTSKPGQRREDSDVKMKEKLDKLSIVQSTRRTISLNRPPRSRSRVSNAISSKKEEDADEAQPEGTSLLKGQDGADEDEVMVDLDD